MGVSQKAPPLKVAPPDIAALHSAGAWSAELYSAGGELASLPTTPRSSQHLNLNQSIIKPQMHTDKHG